VANGEMSTRQIKEFCIMTSPAEKLLSEAVTKLQLSARSFHRLVKLSRTIADLSDSKNIDTPHIAEALQYRPRKQTL
jgi:magnesium chelatase family protein